MPFVRAYWRPRFTGVPLPSAGPCFIYGNHCNRWDPFILNRATPWFDPTAGVMTQEFFRTPFLRWALSSLDVQPTRKRVSEPHLIRELVRMLDAGRKIVIFPEGGSRWSGRPEPWIESTAKLFLRMGVPIYPVVLRGSYASWPRWARYHRPGQVEIEVLKPLRFERGTTMEEALRVLKEPIAVDDSVTPEDLKPRWAYKPAVGIERLLYRNPETGLYRGMHSPDGEHVLSTDGALHYRMLPDSLLRDERTGETLNPADMYEKIRAMPFERDGSGAILTDRVDVHEEENFPEIRPLGTGTATLRDDAIRIALPDEVVDIALDEIVVADVERNYKLQLHLRERVVQLDFLYGGSALAWRDLLSFGSKRK